MNVALLDGCMVMQPPIVLVIFIALKDTVFLHQERGCVSCLNSEEQVEPMRTVTVGLLLLLLSSLVINQLQPKSTRAALITLQWKRKKETGDEGQRDTVLKSVSVFELCGLF